jgi:dipeptide/tripeptide permease
MLTVPSLLVGQISYFYWSINIGALLGMGICSTLHHLDDGTAFWLV